VIGLTLVVADDSGFITLFIVILFHQNFEGLALGSRIGELQIKLAEKMIMATAFALVTPIGMAIGIGVLNQFNGNDPATIIAIGTLDALSAGILLYVGLVEMLAQDWMHGELARAPMKRIIPAAISLVAGLVLMSVLGKWA
jgi:zinc transporter 1/2/3